MQSAEIPVWADEQTKSAIRCTLEHLPPWAEASGVVMSPIQAPQRPQIFFHISGMTSPQSADAVRGALMRLDDRATVRIDLPMRRVEIDPMSAGPAAFRAAIADVGYSSVRQWPSDGAYI